MLKPLNYILLFFTACCLSGCNDNKPSTRVRQHTPKHAQLYNTQFRTQRITELYKDGCNAITKQRCALHCSRDMVCSWTDNDQTGDDTAYPCHEAFYQSINLLKKKNAPNLCKKSGPLAKNLRTPNSFNHLFETTKVDFHRANTIGFTHNTYPDVAKYNGYSKDDIRGVESNLNLCARLYFCGKLTLN